MEGNKLIAEFMEVETSNGIVYQDNNTNEFHRIKYHESWDWLMPVVQKIEQINQGVPQQLIHLSLFSTKEEVYQAVIEFIKTKKHE